MQIKTTVRYHFTSARMASVKKFTNNKCRRRCERKGTLLHCWWECKLVQLLWRTVWRFLKRLKTGLQYHPAISQLSIYLEKNMAWKDTFTTMLIAALVTIAKTWKQPKCLSAAEWIKKMWCMYMMEYYSAIKKNEIMPFAATWMDLGRVILSEVSQTEKEKYHITSLIYEI